MHSARWLLTHAATLAVLGASIASCNSLLGLDPIDALQDASIQPGDDAVTPGADASPLDTDAAIFDAAPPGEGGTVGEAGVVACAPGELPPANAIYVSAAASVDGAAPTGSPALPYPKLAEAVVLAAYASSVIVVDEGTYPETLNLQNLSKDLTIVGGFVRDAGGVWKRDCEGDYAARTLVVSTANVGLRVGDCSAIVTLKSLSVQTAPAGGPDASSRIGILVVNSKVLLANVRVSAAQAGAAPVPLAAPAGIAACTTSTVCSSNPAEGTTPGEAASALGQGAFTKDGYMPANGTAGTLAGGPGSNGAFGGQGQVRNDCGGSGSCAGTSCSTDTKTVTGAPGECGCGGTGGMPGGGGAGGGSSVGVLAFGEGSILRVEDSVVTSSAGGQGAAGGAGGVGGNPTAGQAGAAVTCWSRSCCVCGTCPACGCYYSGDNWPDCCTQASKPVVLSAAGGTAGGAGQPGGAGQRGGAGAGGPSYAIVHVAGAKASVETSALAFGSGGVGGAGAANGTAGPTFTK